jgi:hypothetical protein
MVALLVEIRTGREEGRHIGARRPARRRRGLLAPDKFVVHICTEFVELCG